MLVYKCNVIDLSGKKQSIAYRANSENDVINYLKLNNFTIVKIKPKENRSLGSFAPRKIKSKDLAILSKQIYSMLKAGVTIVDTLELLVKQTENKRLSLYIQTMYEDLQKGYTFSESLRRQKGAFPEIFISMVEAGEISGNLNVIMDRLAKHYEKEYKIENKIKSAMTYPLILSIVSTLVVIYLLTSIMPIFVDMYLNSGVSLPYLTMLIISLSNFIKRFWILIVFGIAVFVLSTVFIGKIPKLKCKSEYFKLKIPLLKSFIIKVAAARFSRTLSTLLSSGTSLVSSLETVAGVTGNLYISNKILETKDDVKKGLPLSLLLQQQDIFPPMLYYMIKIGEDSGSLEELLDKTADFYDEEIETSVEALTTLLEPVMIVFMAIIIGTIVIAMVLPMFEMVRTVQ